MSYALRKQPVFWRSPSFGIVALLHAVGLVALVQWEIARPDSVILQALAVRMIEPEQPKVAEPRPLPMEAPKPTPRRVVPQTPPPVLAAAPEAPSAPAAFAVAPQPAAEPRIDPKPAAPAAPAPVSGARFDADYLQNPKPVYPPMSRRLGEEGKVILRVRVSAEGHAREVEIKQGSGFSRLDAAARDAVARWRFVPAKRGDEAVESWVAVPIQFALES